MPNIDIVSNEFVHNYTTVQSGTHTISLDTENTFVDKKIKIKTYTPPANIGAGSATSSITIDNSTTGNSTNVQAILSNASTARPNTSGKYYIGFNINASGNSQVNTAGWIDTNTSLGAASTSLNQYYEVAKASGNVNHNASVSIAVTATPTNVVTSSSNNGIKIAITGGATASGSVTAAVTNAGYYPIATLSTTSIAKSNSTSKDVYITGVVVPNTTFTVTASSNTQGIIKISAYTNSTATSKEAAQTIVNNGVWTTNNVTPGTSAQTKYGKTIVAGDTDLKAANIKHNVVIFNVTGTFTSDGTVTAGNILSGQIGYSKGTKYTGSMANNGALNKTITTQNGTITVTAGYYSGGTVTAKFDTTQVLQNSWSKSTSKVITTTAATWDQGYIATSGNIPPVTFSNTSNGGTFIELSDALTSTANGGIYLIPEAANNVLYITKGYIDNVSIDIGRLIPDVASVSGLAAGHILSGHSAYDQEGNLISGNIGAITLPTSAGTSGSGSTKATLYAKTSDQYITIPAGYLATSANYKFNKISSANYSAGNIKYGVVISVNNGSSNVWSITGTFASDATIAAADVRKNKIGYNKASKITGTMPDTTASSSFVAPNLTTYFTSLGSTATTGNISITPRHTVTTAGYITTVSNQAGTTYYYNIKTTEMLHNASSLTATKNDTAQSGVNPFSIYTSSNTHNILITTATTTAAMGNNKVFIRVDSSGSVKVQTAGWIAANTTKSSTSLTRYIALQYYTGSYTTTDG